MKNHKLFPLLFAILGIGCTDPPRKIGLQPYSSFQPALADTIAVALQQEYGMAVQVLNHKPLPAEAFIHIKTARYRADSLLRFLKRDKPDSLDYIIGLTGQDISFTKKQSDGRIKKPTTQYSDWGILGLGYVPGSTCIVSSFRLRHPDQHISISRLKKVAIHELGHNLGLLHCSSKGCVMQDAVETIETIDGTTNHLCPSCKNKLP